MRDDGLVGCAGSTISAEKAVPFHASPPPARSLVWQAVSGSAAASSAGARILLSRNVMRMSPRFDGCRSDDVSAFTYCYDTAGRLSRCLLAVIWRCARKRPTRFALGVLASPRTRPDAYHPSAISARVYRYRPLYPNGLAAAHGKVLSLLLNSLCA